MGLRHIASFAGSAGALMALAVGVAAAAPPPTLTASGSTVPFGSMMTLQGTIPGAGAGQQVQIVAQVCGFSGAVPVGMTSTKADGKYSYSFQPMLNSTVFVRAGDATSRSAPVRVRPVVQLRVLAPRIFAVDVSSGNGAWFTKAAQLQRYDARAKSWKTIASAPLTPNSDPGALVAVSSAKLQATVRRGTKLRAVVSQATVGSCYLPAASSAVTA